MNLALAARELRKENNTPKKEESQRHIVGGYGLLVPSVLVRPFTSRAPTKT